MISVVLASHLQELQRKSAARPLRASTLPVSAGPKTNALAGLRQCTLFESAAFDGDALADKAGLRVCNALALSESSALRGAKPKSRLRRKLSLSLLSGLVPRGPEDTRLQLMPRADSSDA